MRQSVRVLNARFDPVSRVQADHYSCLVIKRLILGFDFDLDGKVSGSLFVIEMSIVPNEAVMRDSPEISLGTAINSQPTIISLPNWRFIQPLHKAHSQTRMHANKRETFVVLEEYRFPEQPTHGHSGHEWTQRKDRFIRGFFS